MAIWERKKFRNVEAFFFLMRPYWKNIVVFILSGLLLTLISLPFPWLTKILIDDVLLRQDDSLLYVVIIATFAITVARAVMGALRTYYVTFVQHAMAFDIKMRFFEHLQNLSFSFWDGKEVAEILSRFRDASESRRLVVEILNTLINNVLYLLIVPVIVFLINWKLALVAGIGLPCTVFSLSVLSKIVNRSAKLVSEKRAEMVAKNQEFLSGVREIQALGIEKRILRRATHINLEFRKRAMKLQTYANLQSLFGSLTGATGVLLYTWYGSMQIIGGAMSVGEFMAFTTFVGYLYGPLTSLASLMVPIQEAIVYSNRFYEVYGLLPEVKSPIKPIAINHFQGKITFTGVSFWYQNDRMVLDHIDLDVAPGKKVAIIGKSGSGKSTLMRLIPRFYDVKEGTIRIDGVDIRDLSLRDLRSRISFVMQDPFFFVDTIYNNITGGVPSFRLEQVIEATMAANVHDFIVSLPDGYDTVIGESGVTLSGGEKKRIAMARAFLMDCPILIMDEATSAVDEKTEMAIRQATARLMAARTTFIVSHRLASVIDSDLIVLMENGRILESGRHEELLALGGEYSQQFYGEENVAGMSSCLATV